jgi:hypothetical protein
MMSRPSVRPRQGRERIHELQAQPLAQVEQWLASSPTCFVSAVTAALRAAHPGARPLIGLVSVATGVVGVLLLCVFPDGRFVPRWTAVGKPALLTAPTRIPATSASGARVERPRHDQVAEQGRVTGRPEPRRTARQGASGETSFSTSTEL